MDIMAYADLGNNNNNPKKSTSSLKLPKKSNSSLNLRPSQSIIINNDEYKQQQTQFLSPNRPKESNSNNPNQNDDTKLNINDHDKYTKPRKQLILMLMCVIVGFYVCLFPLKIWTLILMFIGHRPFFLRVIKLRHYWYISIIVRFFFYANSSINPIMYNYMSKKFRRAFKGLFVCRLCNLIGGSGNEDDTMHDNTNVTESEYKRSASCSTTTARFAERKSRVSSNINIERDQASKIALNQQNQQNQNVYI